MLTLATDNLLRTGFQPDLPGGLCDGGGAMCHENARDVERGYGGIDALFIGFVEYRRATGVI